MIGMVRRPDWYYARRGRYLYRLAARLLGPGGQQDFHHYTHAFESPPKKRPCRAEEWEAGGMHERNPDLQDFVRK